MQSIQNLCSENQIKWESAKRAELSKVEKRLRGERSKVSTLASILNNKKLIKMKKSIKFLKKAKESLSRKKTFA